ncbi:CCA tRNA nucleotidyltransferase 1, mitochondrial, partial [Stegodyphus mimosarum]
MELKKILSGNFAKELILQMIDLGIGPFIGFPQNPNVQKYEDVCNRSQAMKPHPMTRLTALLKNEEEVLALHSRMKFSTYDKELSLFILNNRDRSDTTIKPFLEMIINTKHKTSDVHERSCEVLKYRGDVCLWKELNDLKIPKFPLSGHTLMERGYT